MRVTPTCHFFHPALAKAPGGRIDVTMCNPPFYDPLATGVEKVQSPLTPLTATSEELFTPGGEAVFVTRMVRESWEVRGEVGWFTCMLGHLGSLAPLLVGEVKTTVVDTGGEVVVGVLKNAGRTRRWVVAWSWGGWKVPRSLAVEGARVVRRVGVEVAGLGDAVWAGTEAETDVHVGEGGDGVELLLLVGRSRGNYVLCSARGG